MGFTGDFAGISVWRRKMLDLANVNGKAQQEIARAVAREVKGVLRQEFTDGEGPEGKWAPTVRGKPALESRKLPNAFTWRFDRGVLRFVGRVKRDWLTAHQEGHEFPARSVGENQRFLTFKNGKLIKNRRALNRKGQAVRGVVQVFARAHTIGKRVLPARPIVPTGSIPSKWATAINRGARLVMLEWWRD